jgi:hypothetical protein
MVDLAPIMVNADLAALNQTKQMLGDQLNPTPASSTGAKKVGKVLPKIGSTSVGDPAVDKFLKSVQ